MREKRSGKKDLYEEVRDLYYNNGLKIRELARQFRRSERTIYRWLKQAKEAESEGISPTLRSKKRDRISPTRIFERIKAFKEEIPHRSAPRIHQLLKQEVPDTCPSVSTIRKYIQEEGLRDKTQTSKQGYKKFERRQPNELWQIDIAGVQTVGHLGPLYLCALLDDCSRYVVAAAYFPDQKGRNVLKIIRDAVLAYGRPNEIVADNGKQFRNAIGDLGTKYSKLLETLGTKPIFASAGHPQTKGKLERWFRTVIQMFLPEGRGWVKKHAHCSLPEFNQQFHQWVNWYNTEKPHQSLPNKCSPAPAQIFRESKERIFRPIQTTLNWDKWLNITDHRKVTKYNQISYKAQHFAIPPGYVGAQVDLIEYEDRLEIYWKDQLLVTHPYIVEIQPPNAEKITRKIKPTGEISYKGKRYSIDYKLAGKTVEIQEITLERKLLIYINGILIRTLQQKEN